MPQVVPVQKTNRSHLLRQPLGQFLEEQERLELITQLKEGYLVHAKRDHSIAEEFAYSDYEVTARSSRMPHDEEES